MRVFVSGWGTMESTEAYLESMLAEEGRYASPRHFSRSVFSSVASVMAIHFGIHGPCETLSFDEGLVAGAMMRAWGLLAARRCQRVLVVWAEECRKIAEHLALQAVKKLGKNEYSRYVERGVGEGAVAVVVGEDGLNRGALGRVDVGSIARAISAPTDMMNPGKPFAADESVAFLRWFLGQRSP
jgi:3-oxoacyl-(acyl-carrier-protein) synthase